VLERLIEILVAASWLYWLAAGWMVRSFFRTRHRPSEAAPGAFTPPVSVLKPVRGLDPEAYENFESFCHQDYPDYEIVFGVGDEADPAVPLIRRLQQEHPERSIRLVVAETFGANRKASLLHHLTAAARYDILVTSDSDMRVSPDYLRRVVAPLADPAVGLVTCPYIGEHAETLPARLEALHMGVSFLPSIVVARRVISMRFAMGASIAFRRRDLERIGGWAAISDYLAEDYQVGARVAATGLRVHLSDYIMADILGATTFLDEWQREVRWARCSRVSRPREYPGLVLSFSVPLALLLNVCFGFEPAHRQALVVSLLVRWVVAWLVTGYTGDRESRRWLAWLPVRDLLTALVWLAGGFGRRIVWRGEEYRLEAGGKMRPVHPVEEREAAPGWAAARGPGLGLGGTMTVGLEEQGGEEGEALEGGGEGAGWPASPAVWHP